MTRSWTLVARGFVLSSLVLAVAPSSWPCQVLPRVPCRLMPQSLAVPRSDPFQVYFTVINEPISPPFPPPYLDDLVFDVTAWNETGQRCLDTGGNPGQVSIDPSAYSVELDEVWSPYADEPTSDTRVFTVTPTVEGDWYSFGAQACATGPAGCQRFCTEWVCVRTEDVPQQVGIPYAEFLEPVRSGAGGEVLPFDLRVLRHGYDPSRPLTVRVLPENTSDPIDIFPLSPPGLSTTGYIVTGDDETLSFTCSLHFPCFVGVDNVYHVTIHDDATLLWDSRLHLPTGIAQALVARAPMARQELVEVRDDGGDGAIVVGEHAEIHLRLYGRNPFFAAALTAAALETAIPTELTVKSYDLHFHDNPMDAYDPTPAELQTTGTVTALPGSFRVDVAAIEARFSAEPPPPPPVFRDLFEVELVLETPPGGLSLAQDLVFPGLTVSGSVGPGNARTETSGPLTIPVTAPRRPYPVRPLYAVRSSADVRLAWDDPATDPTHGEATSFGIYRSATAPDSGYAEVLTVADTPSSREEGVDPGVPSTPGVHYYRIVARNADGDSGDVP